MVDLISEASLSISQSMPPPTGEARNIKISPHFYGEMEKVSEGFGATLVLNQLSRKYL
jgi:hypothetical protein